MFYIDENTPKQGRFLADLCKAVMEVRDLVSPEVARISEEIYYTATECHLIDEEHISPDEILILEEVIKLFVGDPALLDKIRM